MPAVDKDDMNGASAIHMRKGRRETSKSTFDQMRSSRASKWHNSAKDLPTTAEQAQNDADSATIRANLEKWFPKIHVEVSGTNGFDFYTQVSVFSRRVEPHEAYMIIEDKAHNNPIKIQLPLYDTSDTPKLIGFITARSDSITSGLLAQTINVIQTEWLQIFKTLHTLRSKGWTLNHRVETVLDEDEYVIQLTVDGQKSVFTRVFTIQSVTDTESYFTFKLGDKGFTPLTPSAEINNITDAIVQYFDGWTSARYEDLLQRLTVLVQI